MLVLSFSRAGASDLDERIRSRISGQTRAIDVSTYHSFAARLLETYAGQRGWDRAPDILPGPDQKRLVADLLRSAGATHVMTMMLHSPQVHGFFSMPVDHLTASPTIADHFKATYDLQDMVVVATDAGGAKRRAQDRCWISGGA